MNHFSRCIVSLKLSLEIVKALIAKVMASEHNFQLKEFLEWEEYLMGIAILASNRCKNPRNYMRGGACLATSTKEVIAVSYDGFPKISDNNPLKNNDEVHSWKELESAPKQNIEHNICHAELNAILHANTSLDGATLYTVFFPCHDCAKMIVQTGITRIVYLHEIVFDHSLFGINEHTYKKAIYMLIKKGVDMKLYKEIAPKENFAGLSMSIDFKVLNERQLWDENVNLIQRNEKGILRVQTLKEQVEAHIEEIRMSMSE